MVYANTKFRMAVTFFDWPNKDVAQLVGKSPQTVSGYSDDDGTTPPVDVLQTIIRLMNKKIGNDVLTLNDFLDDSISVSELLSKLEMAKLPSASRELVFRVRRIVRRAERNPTIHRMLEALERVVEDEDFGGSANLTISVGVC